MAWTYTVKPYLYGLPGTTSRAFTFDELKHTFVFYDIVYGPVYSSAYVPVGLGSFSGISILSVDFDAASSKVVIKFSYQNEIKYENFELYVNVTYLRTDLTLPYFNTTPDNSHQTLLSSYLYNSMIGQYYTEE